MLDDTLLDRRTLLRWLAAGAGAAAVAGCSGSGGSRGAGPTPSSSGRTSTTRSPQGLVWSRLQSKLTGRLVLPAASSYLSDLQLYDPRFDTTRPAAIAYCADPTDVQHCISFARSNDVAFTARSGGHSYAGYSSNRGLVIDVTTMNGVALTGSSATIGAGARLIDIYGNLNGQGVSIPGGSCPTVGIAGLTLGGGIGVVGREHGLTCDAVSDVFVVTADSRLVHANTSDNDDLFWALRGGGGGNFAVVTGFQFDTFATSDVALFTLRFPWAAAADVLPAWMGWIDGAPDPLWSNCILSTPSTNGGPSISIGGIWGGPQSGVAPLIAQLVTATGATPTTNFLETIPLAHAMYVEAGCGQLSQAACHLPSQNAQGQLTRGPSFAASNYLDNAPSDAGIQAIVGAITARGSSGRSGAIAFDSYGGAINRVDPSATAFVHRQTLCCAQYSVNYNANDSAVAVAGHQAWVAQCGAALRPYVSNAAYQNYIDPTLTNSLRAYYGNNLSRLETLKKKWDPDDAFHFAQSIPLP